MPILETLALGAALYTVPVEDPALADLATFDVPRVELAVVDGKRVLDYDLPLDLIGPAPYTVALVEVPADETSPPDEPGFTLSGPRGHAWCTEPDGPAVPRCEVTYTTLEATWEPIERHLRAKYAGDPRLEDRVRVAYRFFGEPVGVIALRKP